MPGLCSLFPRQRSTRTWTSGPGRFRQGGRVQIERLETVPLRNWGGNWTISCCSSSLAERECRRDGVSECCSSDSGEEQTWPGWTDARSRSLAPLGYSPAAPYSGPLWYCPGPLQRSSASYSTGVCRLFSSQSSDFSSSHVRMWELDHKEDWALRNRCFQTVVLEKTLESPLSCKEIKPVNPKGNQPWIYIANTDAEAETPVLWPPDWKSQLIVKDPDACTPMADSCQCMQTPLQYCS